MPAPTSLLIVSAPAAGSPEDQLEELDAILHGQSTASTNHGGSSNKTYTGLSGGSALGEAQRIAFPEFKVRLTFLGEFTIVF